MDTRRRCKGCKSYLTVPSGQPCSVCNTINTSKKKKNGVGSQILNYIDGYANRLSPNNHYVAAYGQPPAYTGYSAPSVYGSGYYNPQQQPSLYNDGYNSPQQPLAYNGGYYSPQQPSTYNDGYNSPQQPSAYDGGYYNPQQPSVYSDTYSRPPPSPLPHAVSPDGTYGSVYPSQHHRPVHEKKRAVLCGVTYKGHKQTLPASVNNVRNIRDLLLGLGFSKASIHILTEEESDPTRIPTRRNIEREMKWLTKGSRSGDSLVFYYAGHGTHVPDVNGDEKDGLDEAICPVDYSSSGKILDDEVNSILVAPLPHGVTLHCIMDTCYSGTLLDLPFLCRIDQGGYYKWEAQNSSQYGATSGGKAISISACDDHQNSADTEAFTGKAIGALTYSFIQAVKSAHNLAYGDLLDNMRKVIHDVQRKQGLNAPFASSTSQEPQLSSSTRFEIYSETFTL